MSDIRETSWNYVGGEKNGTFFTSERKWINKIYKWKEKYPDLVNIRDINQDGSLVVNLPECWCKISPKKQINMTQEQKDQARDRLAKIRDKNRV